MLYRSEIDGLRALAVLSVVIFHFLPSTLEYGFNGFLGVDVFFVISGFLISKFIYKGLLEGNFSFKDFYIRRIKRILPAALFVLIPTTILSIVILIPNDLLSYFKSLLSAIFFVPNIFFWRNGGYFGDLDSLKPLLHYWSLGVEEQFYLFFPIFVYLCFKFFGKKNLGTLIWLVTTSSFILNIYLLNIGGSNPAFFLLPTRIWEFGFGALAALYSTKNKISLDSLSSNILFILMLLGLFLKSNIFIVSVVAIYLFFNHSQNSLSYKVLSNKLVVFLGKISFSLYLIHWPVVVFLNYIFVDYLPRSIIFFSLIFLIGASYLSYQFIEKPFRYRFSKQILKKYLTLIFITLVSLSIIGLNTNFFNIEKSKLVNNLSSQIQTHWRCPVESYRLFGANRSCAIKGSPYSSNPDLVILGNSHAQMYVPIFYKSEKYKNILVIPVNSCLPTPNVNISTYCAEIAQENLENLEKFKNDFEIVIGMTWYDKFLNETNIESKKALINDFINMIEIFSASGKKVSIISPMPVPNYNHASYFSRKIKFNSVDKEDYLSLSKIDFDVFYDEISIFDKALSESSNINYIKVYESLCDELYCYYGDLGGSYFSDSHHISKYGLEKVNASFKSSVVGD